MDDFFKTKSCDRCGKSFLDGSPHAMSRMNTDIICTDCREEEERHPLFKEAKDAELAAFLRKDYNYKGLFAGQAYPFTEALKARNIHADNAVLNRT